MILSPDRHARLRSQEMYELAAEYKANIKSRPCKKCGRPIGFVETPDGKKMPVDVTPIRVYMPDGFGGADLRYGYSSHFDSCTVPRPAPTLWEAF